MINRKFNPPLGITHQDAVDAYREEGTFRAAAERLGCSKANVQMHVHQTTVKVRRSTKAFHHVMGSRGRLVKVRLYPDEYASDSVPPP
jgi:hypothetical protein